MGIRNKVTKDGFVSTSVDGDVGLFGMEQEVFSAGSNAVETGVIVLSGSGVTAVLPDISTTAAVDGTVADGLVVKFVVASANTFTLSASDAINAGAWTALLAANRGQVVQAVGVSGLAGPLYSTGCGWFITSGSIV